MNICFLYNELPSDIERVAGQQFTGPLSVDAHLDTVLHGVARFVKDAKIFLIDKRDLHFIYLKKDKTIERVRPEFDASGCLLRFDYMFISPYAIYSVDEVLSIYIVAKTVLSIPAIWWYEHPDIYPYSLLERNILDFKRTNTCFIVPNDAYATIYPASPLSSLEPTFLTGSFQFRTYQ